jgi:hypothetical protein
VEPNRRRSTSSQGLSVAVEVKAPISLQLRSKEICPEARAWQGKIRICFPKNGGGSLALTPAPFAGYSIVSAGGSLKRKSSPRRFIFSPAGRGETRI